LFNAVLCIGATHDRMLHMRPVLTGVEHSCEVKILISLGYSIYRSSTHNDVLPESVGAALNFLTIQGMPV